MNPKEKKEKFHHSIKRVVINIQHIGIQRSIVGKIFRNESIGFYSSKE